MIAKVMCFQTKPSSELIKILSKQSPFSFRWAFVNIFVTMIPSETCARHMWASCPMEPCVQAHATGAQHVLVISKVIINRIQHKSFAVYFAYTAVHFQVYGRTLGGIRPYTSSIRCSLVAPKTKAIGQ